jgi:EGF-like domain
VVHPLYQQPARGVSSGSEPRDRSFPHFPLPSSFDLTPFLSSLCFVLAAGWLTDKSGSCTVPNTCNGRGTCSHFTGLCKCTDPGCWTGNSCQTSVCGGHSSGCSNGTCACFPNYSVQNQCQTCDACHVGVSSGCVTLSNTCSNRGTCQPSTGACLCDAGYTGDSCASTTGGNGGAVAAGILIPTIILGLGGALFYWKRKNPHKAFSDLVPSTSGIFNFGRTKYTKMTATSTSSSSMGSPGLSSGFISRQSSARGGGSAGNTGSELASYGGGRASLKASTGGGYGSYGT